MVLLRYYGQAVRERFRQALASIMEHVEMILKAERAIAGKIVLSYHACYDPASLLF